MVRPRHGDQFAVNGDGKDIDLVFAAHVQGGDALADPRRGHGDFIDGIFVVQFDIVEDVFRIVTDSKLDGHLFFRVDHLIGTGLEEEFLMMLASDLGDDAFCSLHLELISDLQAGRQIVPDGDVADIEAVQTEGAESSRPGAVGDLRVIEQRRDFVDAVGVAVDDHDLVTQFFELAREVITKSAHADHEYGSHKYLQNRPASADHDFFHRPLHSRSLPRFGEGQRQRQSADPAEIHQKDQDDLGKDRISADLTDRKTDSSCS